MTAVRGATFGDAAVPIMKRVRGARAATAKDTIFILFLKASPRAGVVKVRRRPPP
jgi:hypothetical protein